MRRRVHKPATPADVAALQAYARGEIDATTAATACGYSRLASFHSARTSGRLAAAWAGVRGPEPSEIDDDTPHQPETPLSPRGGVDEQRPIRGRSVVGWTRGHYEDLERHRAWLQEQERLYGK